MKRKLGVVLMAFVVGWVNASWAEDDAKVTHAIEAVVESADVQVGTWELVELSFKKGKKPLDEKKLSVQVHPGDMRADYVGERIRGQLVEENGGYKLQYIWPADPLQSKVVKDVNEKLNLDTIARGRRAYRAVGEYLPDFALYDQSGAVVRKATYRGKKVVLNFIFTRCMVPKMCPAATARLVRLQREAKEDGVDGFQIVSISFDPGYDTPGVLNEYGKQRGIDFDNFSLLTGDKRTVDNLMKQFGILIIPEDGTLNHTMATLLIDEKGKIIYRKDGSRWSSRDFIDRLKK